MRRNWVMLRTKCDRNGNSKAVFLLTLPNGHVLVADTGSKNAPNNEYVAIVVTVSFGEMRSWREMAKRHKESGHYDAVMSERPYNRLSSTDKNRVNEFIEANPHYYDTDPLKLSAKDCVDAALRWEGIIGYDSMAIELVSKAFGFEVK